MDCYSQEFIDNVIKAVIKQTKGTIERAEDAVLDAYGDMIERENKGELINDPMAFLVLVAKRRYYDVLRKESREGMYIPYHMTDNTFLEESFLGEDFKDILLELSNGHPIRDVAMAYGLTYYQVYLIRKNWINS